MYVRNSLVLSPYNNHSLCRCVWGDTHISSLAILSTQRRLEASDTHGIVISATLVLHE